MLRREDILREERLRGGRAVSLRRLFNEQQRRLREGRAAVQTPAAAETTALCLKCSHAKRKGRGANRLAKVDMVRVAIQSPKTTTKTVRAKNGGTREMRSVRGTCPKCGNTVSQVLKNPTK